MSKHKCKCGRISDIRPGYGYGCECGLIYKISHRGKLGGCKTCGGGKRKNGGVHRFYQFKEK